MDLSVIIPTLNEEKAITETLRSLGAVSRVREVIVSDGGSTDATRTLARAAGARVIDAPRGRGSQLRAGATQASGSVLWFLHADTRPACDAAPLIQHAFVAPGVIGGSFRLRFDGDSKAARFLTGLYPHLKHLGLSYGDAGLFVQRDAYEEAGGFRDHPLFEDLDLIRRLRQRGILCLVPAPLVTSSRRFEGRNFAAIFAGWTLLQVLFWLRVPPATLARLYPVVRERRMPPPPPPAIV